MSEPLLQSVVTHLKESSFDIPALPQIATQALALAQDEDSTARDLADLICKDQALASTLLRTANSAAYAGARTIASLQQAITLLGMQTVAELAVAICVKGSLFPKKKYAEISQELWNHALASALFAKEVARQQRRNVEAAYICGLLHRIGMPIVLKAVAELGDTPDAANDEEVRGVLDKLHVEIGLKATDDWKLPSQVTTAIASASDYENAAEHRHIAAIVHLSSALASELLSASDDDGETVAELSVLEELSIYPEHLKKIMEHKERIEALIA